MKDQENLEILRKIYKHPNSSQRELAKDLGFSLGKLNYCIKALQQKGLVKIKNFQSQNDNANILLFFLLKIFLAHFSIATAIQSKQYLICLNIL